MTIRCFLNGRPLEEAETEQLALAVLEGVTNED